MSGGVDAAVLVPLKAFSRAKTRLAAALPGDERADLVRAMARRVLSAAAPLPVVVACDDAEVAAWSRERGASVVRPPVPGLDQAVEHGVAALAAAGVGRVVVAHADLPLATRLAHLAAFPGVTLVPDRRLDGTNVACVPAGARFPFSYGPGSFGRHAAAARRLGLALRVVHDFALAWDVDVPADLAFPSPADAHVACR